MRGMRYIWLAGIVLSGMAGSVALCQTSTAPNQNTAAPAQNSATAAAGDQEPSLGSYARSVRKNKAGQSVKTFDNDNIPRADTISVVGSGSASDSQPAADSGDDTQAQPAGNNPNQMPKVTPGQSEEQRKQVYDQWQTKITDQQSKIDGMARELDLDQREYRLRAASFYADAGERLRNQAGWDKEDAEYKQKIAEKQKALDDAKQAMGDLQEQARKAGVPTSEQQPEGSDSDSQ
jgi:hypothetical protein